jgi:hypothetical protein
MRGRSIRPFLLGIATFFLDERAAGLDMVLSDEDSAGVSCGKCGSVGSESGVLTGF